MHGKQDGSEIVRDRCLWYGGCERPKEGSSFIWRLNPVTGKASSTSISLTVFGLQLKYCVLLFGLQTSKNKRGEFERPLEGAIKTSSMMEKLPVVYIAQHIARHGNTAWTHSGQHTGRTDLPLTPDGERNAMRLGERLKGMTFAKVFTSPLHRASRTCELAGFGAAAETDPDLVEWDYGSYEGLTSAQILQKYPNWDLFHDGAPEGESPAQIGERADRVVERIRHVAGDVLFFSSGHFIRVFTARWLGLGPGAGGRYFLLSPASLSAVSYEHNLSRPVIRLWNDDHHVGT